MTWKRTIVHLPLLKTIGSASLSRSLVTTDVGNIRTGFGFAAVDGEHLFENDFTIGRSMETGSPLENVSDNHILILWRHLPS